MHPFRGQTVLVELKLGSWEKNVLLSPCGTKESCRGGVEELHMAMEEGEWLEEGKMRQDSESDSDRTSWMTDSERTKLILKEVAGQFRTRAQALSLRELIPSTLCPALSSVVPVVPGTAGPKQHLRVRPKHQTIRSVSLGVINKQSEHCLEAFPPLSAKS